ncbi:MAG: BREX-1 system adenine-specific DNA-methyltransferase PglX [Bacteroidaceae bacterium]|nr:BREX-1 system adenine-specific DNA-methyltransferase PglX [Bacteroidaceae bacterium]
MALFQNNILNKYVALLNSKELDVAYSKFCSYFHDVQRQNIIKTIKEEEFQDGFLRDLFVNILGYTLKPDSEYNLVREKKDVKDSKKSDGAILVNNDVVGVIELKDMKTPDIDKVESQAFGYKNQHRNATYVVISNFQKLRFYIDNAVDYIEWNLFSLSREEFDILWLCLSYENIKRNLPKSIKSESVSSEEQITNKLYKDYIAFKRELFDDILQNNTTEEGVHSTAEWKILLFKKTQKLLDRLLFIFFAEDEGLLPPNSMVKIIDQWRQLLDLDENISLYSRIRKYFGYLDTGFHGKEYDIFAYNGGMFKPDEVLDSITISDELLATHTRRLSEYDFVSEVDVNILGHIFENSLTEIEDVTNQLQRGEGPAVSKRKKDGVFYTPQYITKYIVENTVGKLCSEKMAELGIAEEKFLDDRNRQKATKQKMLELLDTYREWLLHITICDPACGSGAFLNAALRFLMDEHHKIDEMQARITGSQIVFQNIENSILENNLFGVDINEESVEIARLSLWLRTAKPNRKLSSLNNNIKCGNSLISDPDVAGEKAFDWQAEFPQVFINGGFDVVIGNPPYVRAELLSAKEIEYYKKSYEVYTPDGDLFSYFYNHGMNILKSSGIFGFISNTFDKTTAGQNLRQYISQKTKVETCVDFTEVQIFEGATTYPIILILSKQNNSGNVFPYIKIPHSMQGNVEIAAVNTTMVEQDSLDSSSWSFHPVEAVAIKKKISTFKPIRNVYGKSYYGVKTALNEAFIVDGPTKERIISVDAKSAEIIKSVYEGKDLCQWSNIPIEKYLICTHNGYDDIPAINIDEYPAIKGHLEAFEPKLSARYDKGNTPYNLRNCAYHNLFYQPKIIWGNLQNKGKFSFDTTGTIISAPACMLPTESKSLLCVLNSRIVWFFLTSICVVRNGGYIEVKPQYFEQIPIPDLSDSSDLSALADKMLNLNSDLQKQRARFVRRIQENLGIEKVSAALAEFDMLDFAELKKELKKQKVRLTLSQQDEWEDYFLNSQQKCMEIRNQIESTEEEINSRVYQLYGLTEEEIKIVEGKS